MKHLQSNRGALPIIEILLVVALISVAAATVYYQNRNDKFDVNPAPFFHFHKKKAAAPPPAPATANGGYLVIKEWGIKVKLGTADPSKIMYTIGGAGNDTAGSYSASAALFLNPSVTSNSNCQKLGISILRRAASINPATKVGDYSYDVGGSPYACGDSSLDSVRQQYLGNNPSSWVYTAN